MRLLYGTCLLLALLPLIGCGDSTTEPNDPVDLNLTGRVLDAGGLPVANARVTVVFGIDGIELPGWEDPAPRSTGVQPTSSEGDERIRVEVFDYAGERVRLIYDGLPPAPTPTWDGNDDGGRGVSPGLYTLRVTRSSPPDPGDVSEARMLLYYDEVETLFERNQTVTGGDGSFSIPLGILPVDEQIEVTGHGEHDGPHEISRRVHVYAFLGDDSVEAWTESFVDVGDRSRAVHLELSFDGP